jgi:hypothetical protein
LLSLIKKTVEAFGVEVEEERRGLLSGYEAQLPAEVAEPAGADQPLMARSALLNLLHNCYML